jgi:hypothetical protein
MESNAILIAQSKHPYLTGTLGRGVLRPKSSVSSCPLWLIRCSKGMPGLRDAFLLPFVEPLHLRPVPATRHVAPTPVMILARIQKKPFAGF